MTHLLGKASKVYHTFIQRTRPFFHARKIPGFLGHASAERGLPGRDVHLSVLRGLRSRMREGSSSQCSCRAYASPARGSSNHLRLHGRSLRSVEADIRVFLRSVDFRESEAVVTYASSPLVKHAKRVTAGRRQPRAVRTNLSDRSTNGSPPCPHHESSFLRHAA